MGNERKSGILLHPTSFPSKYGIGDFGKEALSFIDFLVKSKQSLWQILPLGHTSFGDSPYQSFSTFAGNPLLISPDILLEKGFLTDEDIKDIPAFNAHKIDYGKVIEYKNELYKKAFSNFKKSTSKKLKADFKKFCDSNKDWLDDYCMFISIKNYFIKDRKYEYDSDEFKAYRKDNLKFMDENAIKDCYYGAAWNSWPEDIASRTPATLKRWSGILKDYIEFYKFIQFEFFNQWAVVKKYANDNGIQIIGDIPIFVSGDSADVWADSELFTLNAKGFPTEVAGVPPDYFSETGQLWGNPLYKWNVHKKSGFNWWVKRIEYTMKTVDIIRIDHFRGFDSYWSVPYGEKTAVNGKWKPGPGKSLFAAVEKKLGKLPIIAEDLGDLNDEVLKLRDSLGFPGMKVLHFAFSDSPANNYLPHNYQDNNCVVYTGTHDNDTTIGWYNSADETTKDFARRYMNISGDNIAWDLIRLAYSSTANFCIIPVQDVMRLGTDCRMNVPGVGVGNWQFRYSDDMLTEEAAEGLAYLAEIYNR